MTLKSAYRNSATMAIANRVTIEATLPYNLAEIRGYARQVRDTHFHPGDEVTFSVRPLHVHSGDGPRAIVFKMSDLIDLDPDAEDEPQPLVAAAEAAGPGGNCCAPSTPLTEAQLERRARSMRPRILRTDETGITIGVGLPYSMEEVRGFIARYLEPRTLADDAIITLIPRRPFALGCCIAWIVDPSAIVHLNAVGEIDDR